MSIEINLHRKNELTGYTEDKIYDLLILGAGPAGLNAALYAKRKGLETIIIAKDKGGQVMDTSSVENYLGFPSLTGEGLVKKFLEHVEELKVPILEYEEVERIQNDTDSSVKAVMLKNGKILKTKTVIIATGSKPRRLGVPGEKEFSGKGVCYCAICDGPLFAEEEVIVAGGGNSAVEAALDLSKIASKVTVVHRSQFRADKILVDQLIQKPNVEIKLATDILEVYGDKFMSGIKVLNKENSNEYSIEASGLFVEIGYLPNSEMFADFLELNSRNEIVVDKHGMTSIPGVFAAGDVTDTPYKQIIMSAADGAKCSLAANDYINNLK